MPALSIYTVDAPIRQIDFDDLEAAKRLRDALLDTSVKWTTFTFDGAVEWTVFHRHITQVTLDPTYKPPSKGTNR